MLQTSAVGEGVTARDAPIISADYRPFCW